MPPMWGGFQHLEQDTGSSHQVRWHGTSVAACANERHSLKWLELRVNYPQGIMGQSGVFIRSVQPDTLAHMTRYIYIHGLIYSYVYILCMFLSHVN